MELVTRREAAEIFNVNRSTIKRLEFAGKLTPVYTPETKNGARLYDRQDVLKLKQQLDEKQKQKTTPTKNNKALAA